MFKRSVFIYKGSRLKHLLPKPIKAVTQKLSRRVPRRFKNIDERCWRESFNYREAYFKKNRGVCGRLYFCSQCLRPLNHKSHIDVDHIIPPSRFVKDGRTNSLLATLFNNTFNCVAICKPCNSQKSDKINMSYLSKGFASKAVEGTVGLTSQLTVFGLIVSVEATRFSFRLVTGNLSKYKKEKRKNKKKKK